LEAAAGDAERAAFTSGRALLARVAPAACPAGPWASPEAPEAAILPAAATQLAVEWEGAFLAQHSLGLVNRELCRRLIARGHELRLVPVPALGPQAEAGPARAALEGRLRPAA